MTLFTVVVKNIRNFTLNLVVNKPENNIARKCD